MFSSRGHAAVCYDCIRVLAQVGAEETYEEQPQPPSLRMIAPRDIYASLDEYVRSPGARKEDPQRRSL